jgi:hypothetical protein
MTFRTDGDLVKASFVATRVFFFPFISLLLFGIDTWNFPRSPEPNPVCPTT